MSVSFGVVFAEHVLCQCLLVLCLLSCLCQCLLVSAC